ncbi:MAG: hypothetical protein PHC92_06580 [Syntrophomonadaceae bacterium]|nr:hypothetical protein [Syntrophomonadaceae bacterium]
MNSGRTEQEEFWAGEFGNEYTERNQGMQIIASNTALFARILSKTTNIKSVLEFGTNRGLNLLAIRQVFPAVHLSAVEINEQAVTELQKIAELSIYQQSLFEFSIDYQRDLVLSKGLLIHINPDKLKPTYELLYQSSQRYICLVEYYNPVPVEVAYRGHKNKLFKRDFAGEMMNEYKDLSLVDYGFIYHRDNNFPQDDLTWFLLEKRTDAANAENIKIDK